MEGGSKILEFQDISEHKGLKDLYPLQEERMQSRYLLISKRFQDLYSQKVEIITRVPSLVRYPEEQYVKIGLPHLYFCIEQDVVVAAAPAPSTPGKLLFSHVENTKYPPFSFDSESNLKYEEDSQQDENKGVGINNIQEKPVPYKNLILCAVKVALQLSLNIYSESQAGGAFFLDSNVPEGISFYEDLQTVTAVVLALINQFKSSLSQENGVLTLEEIQAAIIAKFSTLRPQQDLQELERALAAIFTLKAGQAHQYFYQNRDYSIIHKKVVEFDNEN